MALPLAGVRVLDLSNVLAGPFCGYHLARLGADVIKIENPRAGDLARRLGASPAYAEQGMGLSFLAVNACKQSVAIDLKSDAGKALFLLMVRDADVVLENFRPGVMQRLGLDYDSLAAVRPELVYCAVSGFGQDGPWAGRPAYDQIVQGLSGAMSVTGDEGSAPLRTGFPLSDTLGGLTAAFAIASAMVGQRSTGKGCFIDVSLLESTLAAMGWVVSNYLNGDVAPQPMGNENFTAAPSGTFRTGEGLLNISANEQKQFETLCRLIGREELVADTRFSLRAARKQHRQALNVEIERGLAQRSALAWEQCLNEAGVPAGRVLSVAEILASAQMQARGFVESLGQEETQDLRVTRPGFRMSGGMCSPAMPPRLGADTQAWMHRLGLAPEEIDRLYEEGVIA